MSQWQNIQNIPPLPGGVIADYGGVVGGLPATMGGMMDEGARAGLMNGLDMDMNSMGAMDMDLDYSPDGQNTSGLPRRQHSSHSPAGAPGSNGSYSSQHQQQQQQQQSQQQQHQQQQQEGSMTGAGAGPLPTGFGMGVPASSSTLTEFTKRRNWSQRIIEELKDFLHILTPDGRILYVSPSCKAITGYEAATLIGRFIAEFVHPDDSGIFMREFNESIASGNSLRFFYRFKKDDGSYMIFECDGHPHISPEPQQQPMPGAAAAPSPAGVCRGFFMMARPYPTKNAALLDSFLEHKIENERLMRRIDELKREEREENAEQDRLYREHTGPGTATATTPHTAATPSEPTSRAAAPTDAPSDPSANPAYQGMPPPAKPPPVSNTALTRQNLDSALSAQKPDSIADKMSRYEASSTHLESIELLTGLRYRDGERSHGISTGDTSPALIRGDAGIAILVDRDRDGPKKDKKKLKVADEYVCADCGTLDSPEWRKGPRGPKTLCNACGLRWAKKEKKERKVSGDEVMGLSPIPGPGAGGMGMQPGGSGGGGSMSMGGLPPHAQQPPQQQQPPGLPTQGSTGSS